MKTDEWVGDSGHGTHVSTLSACHFYQLSSKESSCDWSVIGEVMPRLVKQSRINAAMPMLFSSTTQRSALLPSSPGGNGPSPTGRRNSAAMSAGVPSLFSDEN
jgi:hypothetical protein